MDAEGILHDLLAVLRGEVLGHPGLQVVAVAGVFPASRHHHHLVGRLDLGRHLGQLELDPLMLGDRLTESLSLLGVADRQLECALGDADAACGHVHPPHLDARHHLLEAAALLAAQHVRRRDAV